MANQFLALSLFIVLLSFFIVLCAISEFNLNKAQPVLNSVTMAFTTPDEEQMEAGEVDSVQMAESQGTTLDQIQGLFSAHITGVQAQQNRMGTEMRLRMDYEDFRKEVEASFNAGGRGSAGRGFLIATLASLMDTQNTGLYKVDMVANMPGATPNTRRGRAAEMAGFAQTIEEAGLPAKMITTGLGGGPEGTIDLHFRRYRPFDAQRLREAVDNDG